MIVSTNEFTKLKTVKNLIRELAKKHHSWARFDSQHVKASQILAKFPWERFDHVYHHSHSVWFVKFLL